MQKVRDENINNVNVKILMSDFPMYWERLTCFKKIIITNKAIYQRYQKSSSHIQEDSEPSVRSTSV